MRLGFHYHNPAVIRDGHIYLPGDTGPFIDSLAGYCEQVICFLHSPNPNDLDLMDYRISSNNVRLIDIGTHSSVIERTLKANTYTSFLRRYGSEMDILLVRGPSPLLPAMVRASPVPTALLLVGDYLTGVDDLPQPRWRKEAIRLWSYWNKWGQDRAARHSLTFVNSQTLYEDLKNKATNLHLIHTTNLTNGDFFIRSDTCQSRPYRLLYVGRMDRSKGLLQMVEAVAWLTERGEDVVLTMVGWQEPGDPVLDEIQVLAKEKNITDRVHYLGSRPLGPTLFEFYREADIFIIASFSEGFPRVIWEAMAHSLPVIATRVGGIPDLIEGKAELIRPRSVSDLVEAIQHLLHNQELRQKYIQVGFLLAQENGLAKQALKMIQKLEEQLL